MERPTTTKGNEMKVSDKIKKIESLIESGHTVTFATAYRVCPVNLKTLNKFRKAGCNLFKADGKSLLMLFGKKYLCVDGCKITYSK